MAKRPAMLSEEVFRESLNEQKCSPKFVDAYLDDCKLLIPLLIYEVGEARFLELVNQHRTELGLKLVDTFWPKSVEYIVGWAARAIDRYKASKVPK